MMLKRSLPLVLTMIAGSAQAAPRVHPESRAWVWMLGGDNVRLGVQLQDMTEDLRRYFGAPADRGVLVARVEPDSAAAKAGLRAGDVILAIDGKKVEDPSDVVEQIGDKDANAKVSIELLRDKRAQTVAATLPDRGKAPFEFHMGNLDKLRGFAFDGPELEKLRAEIRALEKRLEKLESQKK